MSVRLNITMDDDVYARLKKEVPPKKLSAFMRGRSALNFIRMPKLSTPLTKPPAKSDGGQVLTRIGSTLTTRDGPSEANTTARGCVLGGAGSAAWIGDSENAAGGDCLK